MTSMLCKKQFINEKTIPNRIKYFDNQNFDLSQFSR